MTRRRRKKMTPELSARLYREAEQFMREANRHHIEAGTLLAQSLEHAKRAGDALHAAKHRVPYKKWGRFRSKHFHGSRETAIVYMRIAKKWDDPRLQAAREGNMEFRSINACLRLLRNDPLRPEDKPRDDRTPQEQEQIEMDKAREFLRKEFAACVRELKYEEVMVLANGCWPALVLGGEKLDGGSFGPAWLVMYQDLKRRVCQVLEEDYYGEWPEQRKREVRRKGRELRPC